MDRRMHGARWLLPFALLGAASWGCASWNVPRIDPTGERLLIWPNELPPGQLGAPVAATGPTTVPVPPSVDLGAPIAVAPAQDAVLGPDAVAVVPAQGDAAAVWPNPGATAVFPEGFSLPGLAPPAASMGPAQPAAPPLVAQSSETLVLTPQRLLAPVGSEVVLKAGICSELGFLLTSQRIEWLLEDGGVGSIVAVGEPSLLHPLSRPKKLTNHYAISRSSSRDFALDRGTADPGDDVQVRRGEAWVTITSPVEGTTRVTAYAPTITPWQRRRSAAEIYWIDAQWVFPPSTSVAVGTPHLLTTLVTRQSDATPIEGWIVRYEVVNSSNAGLAPDGRQTAEVRTDAAGQANIEIRQSVAQRETVQVQIQVIRPPDDASGQRLVLGSAATSVSWTAPDISIDASGPAVATTGALATYQIQVTNTGDVDSQQAQVFANVPPGMSYSQSNPPATQTGQRLEWSLGDVQAQQQRMIVLDLVADRSGTAELCARVQTADNLTAESCVRTQIASASARLEVRMTGPNRAEVGSQAVFEVTITNVGEAPATGLVITDRYNEGFLHPDDTERTGQVQGALETELAPGASSQPVRITLEVLRPGRLCHEVEVTADGGLRETAEACLQAVPANVAPPQLAVQIRGNRQARVGELQQFEFEVANNGTEPLENVELRVDAAAALEPTQATEGHRREGRAVVWTLPRLDPGRPQAVDIEYACRQAVDATIQVTATAGGVSEQNQGSIVILEAEARPTEQGERPRADESPETNTGPETGEAPQLEVQIFEPGDPLRRGPQKIYQLRVINRGQQSVRNVKLKVTLPPQYQFNRTSNRQGTLRGNVVEYETRQELRSGEDHRLMLVVDPVQAGLAKVTVEVTADGLTAPLTKSEDTEILP